MQLSTLLPVLQNIALALFCLGLVLGAVVPSRREVSDKAVHAGVVLLASEFAIIDGDFFSRAYPLFTIAVQFTILQLTYQPVLQSPCGPSITLLEAVEVTLALTGASRAGVAGFEMACIAAFLTSLLVISACVASLADCWLYPFLTRDRGLPMVALSLALTLSVMLRSPHYVVMVPVAFGTYVSQTDVVWLALFVALSSCQSLYDRDAHGRRGGMSLIALILPCVVACCLTYLGDLVAGVSLGFAACCIMVRRGRSTREVRLAVLSCFALPLLLSAFAPNMSGCWGAWLAAGDGFSSNVLSARGWMGNVLSRFGVPGSVCMVVLNACTIYAGMRSILNDAVTGVMVPFLCLSWGVELAIDSLATIYAIPLLFSYITPLSGISNPLVIPLLAGPAVGIAMACDLHVAEMVADDPDVAWHFGVGGATRGRESRLLLPESTGGERQ